MNPSTSIQNIQIEGVEYFSFPIDAAIEYSPKIATGFYVPLGPKKKVRIEIEGNIAQKLQNYKDKGLKNILLAQADYDRFMWRVKRGLTIFFFNELATSKKLTDREVFIILRKAIKVLGLKEDIAKICEPLISQNLKFIRTSSHLNTAFKLYSNQCQEQYIFHLFRAYLSVALAQEAGLPPHIYDKFIQVNLLCDLQLSAADYESYYVHQDDPSKWTENYREHPKQMARFIERHLSHTIGPEVVKWVELHEENPDGSGFPFGMQAASFDQMTSIIIVSRLFMKGLLESEFSYQERKSFLDTLVSEKMNSSHFKNTRKALYRIMNLVDNEDTQF